MPEIPGPEKMPTPATEARLSAEEGNIMGSTGPGPQSEPGKDGETWDVAHVGAADTPDHGAQAMMRTTVPGPRRAPESD